MYCDNEMLLTFKSLMRIIKLDNKKINMENVKLIDVTIRDGGYKFNFNFTNIFLQNVITGLDQAGIDYIEVGYRNGSFNPINNIGNAGLCSYDYLQFCRKFISQSKLTVMIHPKNIKQHDIREMKECGVDCIRVCFPVSDMRLGFQTIEMIKDSGVEFFVNITRASQYDRVKLSDLSRKLDGCNPSGIYMADSNGSLTPEEVGNLYFHLSEVVSVPLGFHAHDNLFLAQANAIAAVRSGAKYVDSSLLGLGKGAGNLRTEGFVSFLCSKWLEKYDLCKILDTAKVVKSEFTEGGMLESKDIIMGVFDLSQDDAANIGNFYNTNSFYEMARRYCGVSG